MSEQQEQQGLAVYEEFRAQLGELEQWNSTQVFDYEDPVGNKEARSHIHKLRQTKGAVEKVRKAEKQEVLERGRRIDGEAREITERLDAMIAAHKAPLDAIEEREAMRQAHHERNLEHLRELGTPSNEPMSANDIRRRLHELEGVVVNEVWEEYEPEAAKLKAAGLETLAEWLQRQEKHEAEQAELERLRAEKAEREQAERDERIRQEAATRAQREAEERAEREREEAACREKEATERAERAERQAAEAAERGREEERRRHQEEQRAKEAQERQEREAEEARRRDVEHRNEVELRAVRSLIQYGFSEQVAGELVRLLKKGKIDHISINY